MTDTESPFTNRSADFKKLRAFGFVSKKGLYTYSADILDGQFKVLVSVSKDGKISADAIDSETGEIYAPLKAPGSAGAFIGAVRAQYDALLSKIAEECFFPDTFKSANAKKIIAHAKEKYGDDPEFLWPKFPQNAILRRADNRKWYAAFLNLPKSKIGLEGDGNIDIIDLRAEHAEIKQLIDNKKYFPGFHMNKRHWLTIPLDGSVPVKEIRTRLDASFILAKKRP